MNLGAQVIALAFSYYIDNPTFVSLSTGAIIGLLLYGAMSKMETK